MRKPNPASIACDVSKVSASRQVIWRRRPGAIRPRPAGRHSDEAYLRAIHVEVKGQYGWPPMLKELLAREIRAGKTGRAS